MDSGGQKYDRLILEHVGSHIIFIWQQALLLKSRLTILSYSLEAGESNHFHFSPLQGVKKYLTMNVNIFTVLESL